MKDKSRTNIYDGILSFQGKWRNYQERVLNESERYLDDGKIHIVAAPGAEKTTLGIELIRRTGRSCLILSPRIVIRHPGLITSITYQTLYSAMAGVKNVEASDESSGETEEVDFAGFEFVRRVKEAGIGTVCLDECHHLKNEWWKALETFMGEMKGVTVIALTATPPYDSTPAQWERYTTMCGPVDAEITVPELVREGSLCPHQDYVWFNVPDREEEEEIRRFRQNAGQVLRFLMTDRGLREAAATHPALNNYEDYFDRMLENPGYLSVLLCFCQASGIPFSRKWLDVLGVDSMPDVSEKWMEYFLQGFLFDDADSYQMPPRYLDTLRKQMKEAGLTERRRVHFLASEKIEKMLVNSRGKLESILQIAACEHRAMGGNLRMLILTDYIRSEYRNAIGDTEKTPGIIRQLTPMWRFRGISRGVLQALQKAGQITSECRVISEEEDGIWFCAWLQGGTDREKNVYADALSEMLAAVDNQRYLLCHGGRKDRAKEYFCVPAVFAGTREKAELFQREMIPYIGRFRLVYTRNPEGRRQLLFARARAFANKNEQKTERKKKLRSALE